MRLVECEQYDETWWSVRRGVPTASEFGSIVTPKKWAYGSAVTTYACQLIADKYDAFYGHPSEFATAAMRTGTIMEPEARRYYEYERDCEVQRVGFCLTDDGRFGCSPDSLVGADGGLELKSPEPKTHVRYLIGGCIPDEYKPQVHGCMIVTGRSWWDFMSYVPGFPKLLVRVHRDEQTEQLAGYLDKFWAHYQDLLRKVEGATEDAIAAAIDAAGGPEESYW